MTPSDVPEPGLAKAPPPDRSVGRDQRHDLLAGGTFVVIGLAFAVPSGRYELGSALQMGPGYYPLVLGGLLVVWSSSPPSRHRCPAPRWRSARPSTFPW
jgi:hypothetical protein